MQFAQMNLDELSKDLLLECRNNQEHNQLNFSYRARRHEKLHQPHNALRDINWSVCNCWTNKRIILHHRMCSVDDNNAHLLLLPLFHLNILCSYYLFQIFKTFGIRFKAWISNKSTRNSEYSINFDFLKKEYTEYFPPKHKIGNRFKVNDPMWPNEKIPNKKSIFFIILFFVCICHILYNNFYFLLGILLVKSGLQNIYWLYLYN